MQSYSLGSGVYHRLPVLLSLWENVFYFVGVPVIINSLINETATKSFTLDLDERHAHYRYKSAL